MKNSFANLQVRRYRPKRIVKHHGIEVVERIYLKLRPRQLTDTVARGLFKPIPVVRDENGQNSILAVDRAKAWEELATWIKYYLIFADTEVQQHQYDNRVILESWDSGDGPTPDDTDLYNWRRDSALIARLKPHYVSLVQRFAEVVGTPSQRGFDERFPNKFGDLGLSDRARSAIYDLRLLFGADVIDF